MKASKLIDLLVLAITSCYTTVKHLDTLISDEDHDFDKHTDYCLFSEPMELVQKIYKEFPDNLQDDEISTLCNGFYWHCYRDTETAMKDLLRDARKIHSFAHELWFEMDNARVKFDLTK